MIENTTARNATSHALASRNTPKSRMTVPGSVTFQSVAMLVLLVVDDQAGKMESLKAIFRFFYKPTSRYARCRLAVVYYRRYAAPLACWRTPHPLGPSAARHALMQSGRTSRVSTRVNPDSVTDELSYFVR